MIHVSAAESFPFVFASITAHGAPGQLLPGAGKVGSGASKVGSSAGQGHPVEGKRVA